MAAKVKRRPVERKKSQRSPSTWSDDATVRGWGNEALALLIGACAAFLGVSAYSAAGHAGSLVGVDSSLMMADLLRAKVGPLGRSLGDGLIGLLGWCAVVPLAWLSWFSWHMWHLDEEQPTVEVDSRIMPAVGLLLMLLCASSLGVLLFGPSFGGALGTLVAAPLDQFLGIAGGAILCVAAFLASLSLSTRQSIGVILARGARAAKDLLVVAGVLFPIYLARAIFLAGRGGIAFLGWMYDVMALGWTRAFSASAASAPDEDDEPLPRPRRRGKAGVVLDERVEEKIVDIAPMKRAKTPEPDLEDDLADDEEYSHVVVMRRKPEELKEGAAERKKRRKVVKDEGEATHQEGDFSSFRAPEVGLLTKGEASPGAEDDAELLAKSRQIESKLKDFGILGRVTEVHPGPVITLFEFEPAPGVKVGKIAALQDDLAMSLRATSIRIIAPIPRKGTVGIEVPNKVRDIVRLRDVLENRTFIENESILTVPLGKDTYGDPVFVDIAKMPHLLIAGATGTGKSVCINAVLLSLLYKASPADLGLIMIDPKVLELSVYEGVPHLRVPVVTVPRQAKAVLDWAVKEMERRYRMMQKFGVRNIDGYNEFVRGESSQPPLNPEPPPGETVELSESSVIEPGTVDEFSADSVAKDRPIAVEELKPLPKIVIVIDELADLMLSVGREVEELITRLAQKARAAGIHLIVATQRPSVDVITGLIKANFPARLSFRVTSRIDSRTILDSMGAERLLGMGDMLFMQPGASSLKRVHGAFVSDGEVKRVVDAIKESAGPCYDQRIIEICERALEEESSGGGGGEDGTGDDYDPVYDKAVEMVIQKGQASTSMVQRAFRIGYNRAARIIEMMERDGVIGPMDGVKPREVLVQPEREI